MNATVTQLRPIHDRAAKEDIHAEIRKFCPHHLARFAYVAFFEHGWTCEQVAEALKDAARITEGFARKRGAE